MSSHVRGNQYCANRSMSREPKHLETCRMSFHVRGNQYCANRSMSRERKHLETCRSTKKSDCSPNSMPAQINTYSWESIISDRISNRSEVRLRSRDREGSSGPGTTDPGPTIIPATRLACEVRGGWGRGRGSFSLCFRAIAIMRSFSRSLSRRSPRK